MDDIQLGTPIVTQDEVAREWALEVFARYKEDATEPIPEKLVE